MCHGHVGHELTEVEVLMQYLNAGSLLTQCHGVNELFNGVFR